MQVGSYVAVAFLFRFFRLYTNIIAVFTFPPSLPQPTQTNQSSHKHTTKQQGFLFSRRVADPVGEVVAMVESMVHFASADFNLPEGFFDYVADELAPPKQKLDVVLRQKDVDGTIAKRDREEAEAAAAAAKKAADDEDQIKAKQLRIRELVKVIAAVFLTGDLGPDQKLDFGEFEAHSTRLRNNHREDEMRRSLTWRIATAADVSAATNTSSGPALDGAVGSRIRASSATSTI